MSVFHGWEDFYVIVGAAAGGLIGLQFVVLTLIADKLSVRPNIATTAYSTPTIIHFCVALLLSAIATAPWFGVFYVSILLSLVGVSGVLYIMSAFQRMRSQSVYKAVFEDWLFHVILPLVGYALLVCCGCLIHDHSRPALFVMGSVALLLLAIGIHNAWDTVIYHVFVKKSETVDSAKIKSE